VAQDPIRAIAAQQYIRLCGAAIRTGDRTSRPHALMLFLTQSLPTTAAVVKRARSIARDTVLLAATSA
jgi:hypothetical protein